jgi:hypothetical protein
MACRRRAMTHLRHARPSSSRRHDGTIVVTSHCAVSVCTRAQSVGYSKRNANNGDRGKLLVNPAKVRDVRPSGGLQQVYSGKQPDGRHARKRGVRHRLRCCAVVSRLVNLTH